MDRSGLKKLSKTERRDFYQSKYDYYKDFLILMIAMSYLAYIFFFLADCMIAGGFSYKTAWVRGLGILPLTMYVLVARKVKDYRLMVPLTYLMMHFIIWGTDLVTYIVQEQQFQLPGMLIMHLMFVSAGFGSPLSYCIIGHMLFLVDIGLADLFIHYQDLRMMFLFNIPCVVLVCIMHHMMQKVYAEQYLIRQQLEHLVVHDQLTKVNNRNKLKELSNLRGEMVVFSDISVSMLLIDIDYFKQVNDGFGHEAGDIVLVHLAKILKETVRVTDYVIRWGGEEFLIILPGCSAEQAALLAEKIRKKVEKSENGICPITISIGIAQHSGGDYHTTIKKADEALYKAKRLGRNNTVLYEEIAK